MKNKLRLLSLLLVASLCTGCGATGNDNIIESEVNNVVVEEVNNDEALLVENTTEPTLAPEVVPVETGVPEPNNNVQSEMNNAEPTEIPENIESSEESNNSDHSELDTTHCPLEATASPDSTLVTTATPQPVATKEPVKTSAPTAKPTEKPAVVTPAPEPTKAPVVTQTPATPKPVATVAPTPVATVAPPPTVAPTPVPTPAPTAHVCDVRAYAGDTDYTEAYNERIETISGGCYIEYFDYGARCKECGTLVYLGTCDSIHHTENIFGANVDPTCTEEGSCVGVTCDCGHYYQPPVIYPALGHDYEEVRGAMVPGSGIFNEDGTCSATYKYRMECTRCGDIQSEYEKTLTV